MLNLLAEPTAPLRWLSLVAAVLAGLVILWAGLRPELAPPGAFELDKVIHLAVFVGLGFLAALPWRGLRTCLLSVAAVSLLGAGLEVAQGMIPERTASLVDWAADTAGALLGLAVLLWIRRVVRRQPC